MININYNKFIADMIRYASSADTPESSLEQILEYIGKNLHSSRAYIFEDNKDGTYNNTYEWVGEGVTAEKENLQNVPYEGLLDVWFREFEKSKNIIIPDIEAYREISQDVYDILKPQNIHSLVAGPIEINGRYIGFYGVDNPPADHLDSIANLIDIMDFVISMMIRLRDNSRTIRNMAVKDQLTNCKNRMALKWAYDDTYDKEKSIFVLMCDLNGLKKINDQYGHDAGDRYICDAADILQECFGEDYVYRLGGDEFVVVCLDSEEAALTAQIAKARIYSNLKKVGMSLGYAYRNKSHEPFSNILREADRKMYMEKQGYYASKKAEEKHPEKAGN